MQSGNNEIEVVLTEEEAVKNVAKNFGEDLKVFIENNAIQFKVFLANNAIQIEGNGRLIGELLDVFAQKGILPAHSKVLSRTDVVDAGSYTAIDMKHYSQCLEVLKNFKAKPIKCFSSVRGFYTEASETVACNDLPDSYTPASAKRGCCTLL